MEKKIILLLLILAIILVSIGLIIAPPLKENKIVAEDVQYRFLSKGNFVVYIDGVEFPVGYSPEKKLFREGEGVRIYCGNKTEIVNEITGVPKDGLEPDYTFVANSSDSMAAGCFGNSCVYTKTNTLEVCIDLPEEHCENMTVLKSFQNVSAWDGGTDIILEDFGEESRTVTVNWSYFNPRGFYDEEISGVTNVTFKFTTGIKDYILQEQYQKRTKGIYDDINFFKEQNFDLEEQYPEIKNILSSLEINNLEESATYEIEEKCS